MSLYINLSDSEALAASQNRLKVLVRPLGEQPPEGYTLLDQDSGAVMFENEESIWTRFKRFPVDTVILGRETWDVFALPNEVPSIAYKSDSTAYPIIGKWGWKLQRPDNKHIWRSPVTMPSDAIRFKRIAKTNRVCLASEVTEFEWVDNGIPSDVALYCECVANRFARRYPKLSFDRAWVEVVGLEVVK